MAATHAKMIHPKVASLLKIPKIEQKTQEWYEARHNLITASDFAQALGCGKFGTQKQLIMKKVESNVDSSKASASNPFFEWGNLFEPVACLLYSKMHNVNVHEFGLLRHPSHDFFGASPDGITDEGVMLEIKCPLKRKIGGDVPQQYYYQIQGQLDVCDLDECDYFECEFSKYDNYDAYVAAYGGMQPGTWSGMFRDGICTECFQNCVSKPESATIPAQKLVYWILMNHNLKRVHRDREFLRENLMKLKEVWDKIVYYRNNQSSYEIELKKQINISTQSIYSDENNDVHAPVVLKSYRLVKIED